MPRFTTGKYLRSEQALYEVLHNKHPDITNFEITRVRDIWSYKAPERLSDEELKPAEKV